MIRLLHLADLHLGWEPKYLPNDKRKIRKNERNELLEKAVNFALEPKNNIDGVVIAGDLFEKFDPSDSLVREVISQLSRITDRGLTLITVPGNHDEYTYKNSVYRENFNKWPGRLITNPMPEHCFSTSIGDFKIHVYSLAYTGGLTKPQEIQEYPRIHEDGLHLAIFHGSLDWDGLSDRSLPLYSSKLINANYDYIALGHYHQYNTIKIGHALAVYPGAVEFKSFNDEGTGKLTVISWDGRKLEVERVEVDIRQFEKINIDISLIQDYSSLVNICKEYGDSNKMVQLSLTGTPRFKVDVEKLLDELYRDFFYIDIKEDLQYFSEEFLDRIASEPTVRGMFVKRIKTKLEGIDYEYEQKVLEQAMLKGLSALEGGE